MTFRVQRISLVIAATALLVVSCAGSGDSGDAPTTTATAPTTTVAPVSTTTTTPATTTTVEPSALERLGYPTSDQWMVETIVSEIDSTTGGLAIDEAGNFYQADFGSRFDRGDKIYKITADGDIEQFAQGDTMSSLTMIVFGPDGNLYQSSYGSDEVFRIAPDGSTIELVASGIRGPTGLIPLEDGSIIVEAYDANTIHEVGPDGSVSTIVSGQGLNGPNGIGMGPDGTIYVTNHRDGGLFSLDDDGTLTELHRFPAASSHLVYHEGSLFVTSRGSYVVYRYDLETGMAEVVAGSGEPGDRDGIGSDSAFGRPNAITVGPDGALYTNHGNANQNGPVTIRRISRVDE